MWLPRLLEALRASDRPVLLVGGEPFGVPFVLDALRSQQRAAWWALARRAVGDEIAQGNALATALNHVLDAPLFGEALPYRIHTQMLRRHAADLQPLWIALSIDRDDDAGVVEALIDLHDAGYGIVIDWRGAAPPPAGGWASRCQTIGPELLGLSLEEAAEIAPGGLSATELAAMWREAGGRFTELVTRAHRRAHLPSFAIPAPDGPLVAEADARPVDPELAVRAMLREGALVEALELAVLAAPALVEDLLRHAGPAYQERGLTRRLHLLLSAVPSPYDRLERVLEWRLVAAAAIGEMSGVLAVVDAHLDAHVAPELRARRAGAMPHPAGFAMAEAAVAARRTPLTVWQYGRLHPVAATAASLLEESVRLAETTGSAYDVARNAGALAAKWLHLGEFAQARAWAQWALHTFDQNQLRDGVRRLQLVNDVSFARLLVGDLAGLQRDLAETAATLEGVLPSMAALFKSTWASVELVSGRPEAALALLEPLVRDSPRSRRASFAYELVRVLHEVGRHEQAAVVAADAVALAGGADGHAGRAAQLARGMSAAVSWAVAGADAADPRGRRGADDLLEVMLDGTLVAEMRLPAALHYLLVSGGAGHHIPDDLARVLGGLHPAALTLFSGPAHVFRPWWDTLAGRGPSLRLSFFGVAIGRSAGVTVELPQRLAEVALALTLHPQGVSREQLNDFLVPEGQPPFTSGGLRGVLTRLRGLLPVSDAPYRWSVPFSSDVGEIVAQLAAGRAREATALWQGDLLPLSDAPGVIEARASLEESLRQAALMSRDAEALYELANRVGDDLELWEACAAALPSGDPRVALSRARCRRLGVEYAAEDRLAPGAGRGLR